MVKKSYSLRPSIGDQVFDTLNHLFMVLLCIVMLYPLLYVLFASISDANRFASHTGILLYPAGFSFKAYQAVFSNRYVMTGYVNTLTIVVSGVAVNLFLTMLGAFVLSRRDLYMRRPFMLMILMTMYFSGGIVPSYFNIRDLNLMDTIWALILPGAVNTTNLIILRTAFEAIPPSLEESAKIDGAGDFTVFWTITLPLSKAALAVMVLYYGVGHWNSWFNASIYLKTRAKYPLQLILREILVEDQVGTMMSAMDANEGFLNLKETIKYATVIVATLPILCIYPLIQKYFTKGVMIGAIKG